jgi:hypothetical protein
MDAIAVIEQFFARYEARFERSIADPAGMDAEETAAALPSAFKKPARKG